MKRKPSLSLLLILAFLLNMTLLGAAAQPDQSHSLSEISPIDINLEMAGYQVLNASSLEIRNGLNFSGNSVYDQGNARILEWSSTSEDWDFRNSDIDLNGGKLNDSTGSLTLDGTVEIPNGDLSLSGNSIQNIGNLTGTDIVNSDNINSGAVGSSELEVNSVTASGGELDSSIAGSGLSGGSGSALSVNAGNALTVNSDILDVNEGGISHDNISDVSNGDHHTRYADNEAQSAVELSHITPANTDLDMNGNRIRNVSINVEDTRDVNESPTNFGKEVRFDFKSQSTVGLPGSDTYGGVMTFAPWDDNSGDDSHQVGFTDTSLYWRDAPPDSSSWNGWRRIYSSDGSGNLDMKGNSINSVNTVSSNNVDVSSRMVVPTGTDAY